MCHLENVNLTYFQHLQGAIKFSYMSFSASIIFMIHGLFPNYFIHTGSDIILSLNNDLQNLVKKDS